MIKYTTTQVCFREVPDEISLCINISNCQNQCKGCHTPMLRLDVGRSLDHDELSMLVKVNEGITCVCFMGCGKSPDEMSSLAKSVKEFGLKTCIYLGDSEIPKGINLLYFDYIKIGPYIAEFGPLDSRTTNQRMYRIDNGKMVDITKKFWK